MPSHAGCVSYRSAVVGQLATEHSLALPAIHIRVLEEAKLIQRRKVGRTNFVAFSRENSAVSQVWMAQYRTAWSNDSETLDKYIKH